LAEALAIAVVLLAAGALGSWCLARARRRDGSAAWRGALADSAHLAVIADAEGRLRDCALADTETDRRRLQGEPLADLFPASAEDRVLDAVHWAARDGEASTLEVSSHRPGGGRAQYEVRVTPSAGDERETAAIVVRDVTRRRRDAQRLEEQARELDHARGTLAAFREATEGSGDPTPGPAAGERAREDLAQAAGRVQELADGLRELVQVEAPHLMPRNVAGDEVARAAVEAAQAEVPAPEASVERAEALPPLYVDPAAARAALRELVDNALRHAGPGARVRVGGAREGDRTRLWVEDDGPGLDPAELEDLAEPFERGEATDEHRPGVGLAIARRVAQRHRGDLLVEETADGTRVGLDLPARPSRDREGEVLAPAGDPARARATA